MSDKFEGAVAALSGIVELAAKPTIRKVRTPEGVQKYGQPIGSVIVTDPSGKVLETLYKGSGSVSGSPSTSSFAGDPKVAKHGAVLPGQGAFAEKAKSAFDKPAAQEKFSTKAADTVSDQISAEVGKDIKTQTVDTPKGPVEIHTTDGAKIYTTGTGAAVVHKRADGTTFNVKYNAKGGASLGAKVPNTAILLKGDAGPAPQKSVQDADAKPTVQDASSELDNLLAKLKKAAAESGNPLASQTSDQKAQSDALQEAQDKADAGKASAALKPATPEPAAAPVKKTKISAGAVSKVLANSGETKGESHAGMVKGMPIVYTGFTVKQNKNKSGDNTDVTVSYQFKNHWTNHNEGSESGYALEKMQKYKALLEAQGYSVELKEKAFGQTYATLTVKPFSEDAVDAEVTPAAKKAAAEDPASQPEPVKEDSTMWPLVLEGTLQQISLSKGNKVWAHAGPNGAYAYYVEKTDGTGKSFRLEDGKLKKKYLTASEIADRKDKVSLTPVNGADDSWKTAQTESLLDSDTKPIKALSAATGISEDQFSAATVLTPKGKQRVYVAPDAKVMLTGTGAAVAYPGGKTIKYNTISGKGIFSSDPNPPHFAEVSIEGSPSAPETPPAASPMQSMGQAAQGATAALQTLQSAISGIAAEKSVKGTKYGEDSNGSKGWQFTTHTGPKHGVVYSDSDQWGNTYLYEIGDPIPISGPHAQIKEAKAWLATNGNEEVAPATSAALPEEHDVPADAGAKIKPVSTKQSAQKKPAAKKTAAPVQKVQSSEPSEENFFTPSPLGKVATVPHPKYGNVSVEYKDGDKVYTTGVGVVVKSPDGSGLTKSGKTDKVEKFDVLPDNKLPTSSTVEVKKKPSTLESTVGAIVDESLKAQDALDTALETKSQKDISDALEADSGDDSTVPDDFNGVPYKDTYSLGGALGQGALPKFVHQHIHDAQGVWTYLPALSPKSDKWRVLLYKDKVGNYYTIAPTDTESSTPNFMSATSAKFQISGDQFDSKTLLAPEEPGLAEWEKELLGLPPYGKAETEETSAPKIPDEIFGDGDGAVSNVLATAISTDALPAWLHKPLTDEKADQLWLLPTASADNKYSLVARLPDGSYKIYFSDSDGGPQDFYGNLPAHAFESKAAAHLLWDGTDPDAGFAFPKIALVDDADVPSLGKLGDTPFMNSTTLTEALEQDALPLWLKDFLADAQEVWAFNSVGGRALMVKTAGGGYETYSSKSTAKSGSGSILSVGQAAVVKSEPTYEAKVLYGAPAPVKVNPATPDLPASTGADTSSVNADNAVSKKVAADWIKAKKTPEGYEFVGVTDFDGNQATAVKTNSWWGTEWETPWGSYNTLKKAKAAAAKHGIIDHTKVLDPAEIKAKAAAKAATKKTKGGPPAGSQFNALGVPEVEWEGHRLPLFPGMRMFAHAGYLHIFDGKDSVRLSPDGTRTVGSHSQKDLKTDGAVQIAFGGSSTLGKFDFSPLKDTNSDKTYDFSAYSKHTELGSLFEAGDLSGMAYYASYLEGPEVPAYIASDAKKYVKSVEVAAHVLQLQKVMDEGGFDGALYAKIDASDVPLPTAAANARNQMRKDYAIRSAKSLGYDVGDGVDALNVDQVKALASSRGFELAPYMLSNENARVWLLTEFTHSGFSQFQVRQGLRSTLKHQKVVAKVAVESKYEKYLTLPVTKSESETAVPTPSQDMEESVNAAMSAAGVSFAASADQDKVAHVKKTGNLIAMAALSTDPGLAFGSFPQATKDAFYTRMAVHGVGAVVAADFPDTGYTGSTAAVYSGFASTSTSDIDFNYTPHFESLQKKYSAENLAALPMSDVPKPDGVPTTTWALVLAALDKDGSLEEGLLPDASKYTSEDLHYLFGVSEPLVADAPPVVKQLLAYGQESGYDHHQNIRISLAALATTGVWGKPWADTYQIPDGPMLYLRPGDKVYYGQKNKTAVYNDFFPDSSYSISSSYGGAPVFRPMNKYSISSLQNEDPLKSVPVNWDFDMAKGFVPQMDEKTFDSLMSALKGDYHSATKDFPTGSSLKGESIVAVKNFFDTDDFSANQPTLKGMGVAGMPGGALAALHHANINDDPTVPQMLEVFANYGYFAPKEKTNAEVWADELNLNPAAAYFSALNKATDGPSLYNALYVFGAETKAGRRVDIEALAEDLSGKKFGSFEEALQHYGADGVHDLVVNMWDQLDGALGKVKKPKKDLDELQLSPTSKKLGGMHSKQVWVDQHGSEWMTKAFPNDPNGDYRVDVEHTANEIARLYGYNAPATRTMKLEGKHQYVQLLAPASGEIGSQSWSSMPETLVIDAMSEHVIDWVISNHDSHHGNILKTPDGQHAYGIDKGQAFKFLGKDKLAEGYLPPGNGAPVWYDNVYAAIRTGQMSKAQADAVRDAVLRKAAQVATRNEDRFTELLLGSQKSRTEFPSKYPDAQAFTDAVNARRKATFDDFAKLYKGLYEKAGYDWGGKDTLDDYLPKKIEDKFHVAPSEDLVESVKKYGTFGVPLFYKTGVFADDNVLVYKTKGSDGSDTLRANATLLSDADSTFMTWLKSHTIEKISTSPVNDPVIDNTNKHAEMPLLQQTYNALVSYSKTVNTHAADGEYNQGTVSNAGSAQATLQSKYDTVSGVVDKDPTALADGFYTAEQQYTWMAHANRMLQQFEIVGQAKSQGVKISAITEDTPFQMPVYKPSEGLDTSGKPKVVDAYDFNGVIEQKWSDGNYTSTEPSGKTVKSTKGDFGAAANSGEKAQSYITKDAPAEVEASDETVESIVSVANMPVTVSYQPASSFAKKSSTGFSVVESGGAVSFTGHEYQIKVGDITIKYQGLEDHSVARAQRGLARVEIGEWDGNPDALEKVNELFESIGLDIGDATEQTMEIGYYRRLAALANRRKLSAKYKDLVEKKIPRTGDQSEVDAYRAMLDGVYGKSTMKEFYDSKGWLPHMSEGQEGGVAGPAHWLRPDSSVEDYKKWTGGRLPVHTLSDHSHAFGIATTGLFSTEDRMRVLGEWIGGMSSKTDQVQYGSSEYIYWRQNSNHVPTYGVMLEPDFAVAGSNYSASGDTFGSTDTKISNSHFDLKAQSAHSGGGNEMMVKKGVTLFDGIAVITVGNESQRDKILKHFKDLGIEEIRGIPVEERIVVGSSAAKKTVEKVWDLAIKAEKKRKGKVA